jgi:hypothetical protein
MRRIAIFALAAACGGGLSGCKDVMLVLLSAYGDPPIHGGVAADQGRSFKGTATGGLSGKLTIRHGFVKSKIRNARFVGTFKSALTGAPAAGDVALGPLQNAQWHARLNATRNRKTGKIKMNGLVLATFTDEAEGRVCLRLTYGGKRRQNAPRGKPGAGRIAVLGGERGAQTLRGTASARVKLKSGDRIRLLGRVKTRRGSPRGFPRACSKLEKTFGLQPLASR